MAGEGKCMLDYSKKLINNSFIILRQVNRLSSFLNSYFNKLRNKEVFFEVQQPVRFIMIIELRDTLNCYRGQKLPI